MYKKSILLSLLLLHFEKFHPLTMHNLDKNSCTGIPVHVVQFVIMWLMWLNHIKNIFESQYERNVSMFFSEYVFIITQTKHSRYLENNKMLLILVLKLIMMKSFYIIFKHYYYTINENDLR